MTGPEGPKTGRIPAHSLPEQDDWGLGAQALRRWEQHWPTHVRSGRRLRSGSLLTAESGKPVDPAHKWPPVGMRRGSRRPTYGPGAR